MVRTHFRVVLLLATLSCTARHLPAQFSSNPGFGNAFTRKKVELRRKLPPVVNITGKSVGLTIEAQGTLKTELQGNLENLLTRSDSNVQVGGTHPDFMIACTVTRFNAPRLVANKEGNVVTQNYVGALSASFRISEPVSGRVVRSGVASAEIDQPASSTNTHSTFHIPLPGQLQPGGGNGPKLTSTMDAENVLVSDVAKQVASYVVNTDEDVPVYLATGGTLNDANKLATSNLWTRNLENLETMTPFSDPHVDAYRLYNIGVANEALAYQAQDTKAAIKYLQEASIDYGKALSAHPDEKYFLEPQNRIKTALAHYDQPVPAVKKTTGEEEAEHTGSAGGSRGITNDDVISMVQAHMDQSNILDNIQSAPKVSFDLSVDGQVHLLHSGVSNQILAVMKQKARGTNNSSPGH